MPVTGDSLLFEAPADGELFDTRPYVAVTGDRRAGEPGPGLKCPCCAVASPDGRLCAVCEARGHAAGKLL